MSAKDQDESSEYIAIVGMAGRFPGARNLDELWRNLSGGVESITFFTDEELLQAGVPAEILATPEYVKASPIIDDVELFDAAFFDFSPRDAEILDPQHRIFLEVAWEALERSGHTSKDFDGWTGVYAGCSISTYLARNLAQRPDVLAAVGGFEAYLANDRDYFSTRTSYKLDLRGPSVNVQTACSTSLAAVHLACQSLLDYHCHLALAGGVRISTPQKSGYLYQPGGITSPDGHCRSFDRNAEGSLFGEGAGVVVLKRLEDALEDGDTIDAVIRGTAMNNDGATKVGYTAPSVEGQAEAIGLAHGAAGVDPDTISYVETHGSGTPLGDTIEISALTQAFRNGTERNEFCAVGSIKSNVGHLEASAGVAGLIKTALALRHRQIPPSLHCQTPNPEIDFPSTPFYVNTELCEWQTSDTARRAGVSSFGMGGTNVHAVLEEAPEQDAGGTDRVHRLLVLSARTATALETASDNLARHLRQHPNEDFSDVAYTLQVGRRAFEHRRMLVAASREDALEAFEQRDPRRLLGAVHPSGEARVVLLLPGLGDLEPGLGQELYEREDAFRDAIDECAELLRPHFGDRDVREVLFPQGGDTAPQGDPGDGLRRLLGRGQADALRTAEAQPALFVFEYALARLWSTWGVEPQAMVGYSLGEYVAACLAGVFSLPDALRVVAARARWLDDLAPGAMLAVSLAEERVREILAQADVATQADMELDIAAINGPEVIVVAGTPAAVDSLERRLHEMGETCRRLRTTHAFHTALMEPVAGPLADLLRELDLQAPRVPFLSNVTGDWITEEEATDARYWTRHLCQPVRFAEAVATLAAEPGQVLLELGAGRQLGALVMQHPVWQTAPVVVSSLADDWREVGETAGVVTALGRLWLAGVEPDWDGFRLERRRRVPLPTYPFERRRFWIEGAGEARGTEGPGSSRGDLQNSRTQTVSGRRGSYPDPPTSVGGSAPDATGMADVADVAGATGMAGAAGGQRPVVVFLEGVAGENWAAAMEKRGNGWCGWRRGKGLSASGR